MKQPSSRHCFICGVDNPVGLKLCFYETETGTIETTYTAPDHFQGYPGVLHGGIVAAILDETSGRAWMGDPKAPRFMFTAKLEVRYRRNVPTGKPLKVVGKTVSSRQRTAEAWAGIYDEKGSLLAEGKTILVDIPEEMLAVTDFDDLGWQVYPD